MARVTNIQVYKGEDIVLNFTETPVPVGGIGGWTIKFSLRRLQDGSLTLLHEEDAVIQDGNAGTYQVTIPGEPLGSGTHRTPNKYYYDVWRTNAGSEAVLAIGEFNILPEVRK